MERSLPRSVLVRGGLGFIGSNLVRALLRRGSEVTGIDNLSTGRRGALPVGARGLRVVIADVLDEKTVLNEANVDAVVHLAALVGTRGGSEAQLRRVNVDGTRKVLDACEEGGAKAFVFASSLAVYGDLLNHAERAGPEPRTAYGRSKLEAEGLVREHAASRGSSALSLRFANVYGPGMPQVADGSVMLEFVRSVLDGTPLRILGDGRQTRDFVHVEDVIRSVVSGLANPPPGYNAFDIGTARPMSINQLVRLFQECSKSPLPVEHFPPVSEVRHSRADIGQAEAKLGFRPTMRPERGVHDLLSWYEAHRSFARVRAPHGKSR